MPVPVTAAVKVLVPPCATLSEPGLTVTPVMTGTWAGSYTLTAAAPDTAGFAVDVAVTVRFTSAVSSAATVRRPFALMPVPVAGTAPPVPVTVQVTSWGGLLGPWTAAAN